MNLIRIFTHDELRAWVSALIALRLMPDRRAAQT